jgi:tRNA(fMet)-specific endonuclease VapC
LIITRYEILRGLKAKKASKQAVTFGRFCQLNIMLPITDEVASKRG